MLLVCYYLFTGGYNHELAIPVPVLVERKEVAIFSIVPVGLYPTSEVNATCVSIKRCICDVT